MNLFIFRQITKVEKTLIDVLIYYLPTMFRHQQQNSNTGHSGIQAESLPTEPTWIDIHIF